MYIHLAGGPKETLESKVLGPGTAEQVMSGKSYAKQMGKLLTHFWHITAMQTSNTGGAACMLDQIAGPKQHVY